MALEKRTKTAKKAVEKVVKKVVKKKAEPMANLSLFMTVKEKAKLLKQKKAYEKSDGKKISLNAFVKKFIFA